MEKIIRKICKKLEKEHKIKILFCVENGSRAWNMSSKDSDYDVRFVFVRSLPEYLQIHLSRDVIEAYFDANGKKSSQENALIDVVGFDIFKYVKMLSSSNPQTTEWLTSTIVYYGKQNKLFKSYAMNNFSRIALYHHYKSMCRQNYLKYLKSGELVTYKKYLYAFRGLVNAKWIAHKNALPPTDFPETLRKVKNLIPLSVIKKLEDIIALKSEGKEKEIIQNIVSMDSYIESFLKDDTEAPKEKSHSTLNALNKELRKIVLSN
ncbi:MAG TPA: nucleotidyltransferase domain-containing protein [Candidatus Nanoarchaeia archaeon]|nr:nucleotidyltransferase domain-containing protein [Candidatus Nanoarchaeia archaeon]